MTRSEREGISAMEHPGWWKQAVSRVMVWGLRRRHTVRLLLAGTLALAGGAGAYLSDQVAQGASGAQAQVYSLAEVDAHLGAWDGRTLLVRGAVVPCMPVPSASGGPCAELVEDPAQSNGINSAALAGIVPQPLVHVGPAPLVAVLQQVPLLNNLVPAPQALQRESVATYRVQLRGVPNSICGAGVCHEALLLDTAPDAAQ
jgi:hypothetical protein